MRLFGDVGIGVPTEIRCGFVELALVMTEGVEPFEFFFECPPARRVSIIPRVRPDDLPMKRLRPPPVSFAI